MPSETMSCAPETATSTPTRFIDADGIRFAYRRLGNPNTDVPPLVMFQHFVGNLDNFDPLIVDDLAINSYSLYQGIANAWLLLYPDANHGSHFQYPDHFTAAAVRFLDATVTPPWSEEPAT